MLEVQRTPRYRSYCWKNSTALNMFRSSTDRTTESMRRSNFHLNCQLMSSMIFLSWKFDDLKIINRTKGLDLWNPWLKFPWSLHRSILKMIRLLKGGQSLTKRREPAKQKLSLQIKGGRKFIHLSFCQNLQLTRMCRSPEKGLLPNLQF